MSKINDISYIRKLTDYSINKILKIYDKNNGDVNKTLEDIKADMIKQGQNMESVLSCSAIYYNNGAFIKYSAASDFVLKNEKLQSFIEKMDAKKAVFQENIKSWVQSDLVEEFTLLKTQMGSSENVCIDNVYVYNPNSISYYLHGKIKEGHYQQAVIIEDNLPNGRDICIQAMCYPDTKNLEDLSKLRSMKTHEPISSLLPDIDLSLEAIIRI